MKVDVNLRGMDGVLETLQSLPAEVVSKRGGPVKLALAKGARVIRAQAATNLRAAIALGGERSTGNLEKRLVVTRGKRPLGGKGERYLVRVRKRNYINALGIKTNPLMTANLLEYGSSHQPATPWLRPAVAQKGEEAINVITADLKRRIDIIVKKQTQLNKAK